MKPENKKFLEDNRQHWITLRDAFYLRGLDGNTRSRMMQVMAEEFRPGYTADLWCPPCVSEMITTLYRHFEAWEAAQAEAMAMLEMELNSLPPQVIELTEAEKRSAEELTLELNKRIEAANFPSHKHKHHRR
jgi:hypothetical protein